MSIGRAHKRNILQKLAEQKAAEKAATPAPQSVKTATEPTIPVQLLSASIGMANKQRILAQARKIRLVETEEELLQTAGIGFDQLIQPGKKSDFNLVLQSLNDDINRLHEIPAIPEKQLMKVQLLAKYMPIVNAYLTSGTQYKNDVLVYCIIWSIDVENFEQAISLADVAIAQNQTMPPNFKRELSDFVVEELAEWACKQAKANQSASPYIDHVIERVEQKEWPVGELIITGKLYRYAGQIAENFEEFATALALYEKAMAVNDQAGCKGRIRALKDKLNIQ